MASTDTAELAMREERAGDEAAIRRVHLDAFPDRTEADLVDRLRRSCEQRLSFVALEHKSEKIVAHVLFTPALGQAGSRPVEGMGLAPLAVLGSHQRRGIGDALTRHGVARVEQAGYPFIIVLGHPDYYPRFGFRRASSFGVTSEYADVPDEAFMLMPLDAPVVAEMSGVVRYRPEFSEA